MEAAIYITFGWALGMLSYHISYHYLGKRN